MIIVGFTNKTSKILPQLLCRKFKHVAIIALHKNTQIIMYQFQKQHHIHKIQIQSRDIKILATHGWFFIYLPGTLPHDIENSGACTCVQFAKHAIDLHAPLIQTPYALYKKIRR